MSHDILTLPPLGKPNIIATANLLSIKIVGSIYPEERIISSPIPSLVINSNSADYSHKNVPSLPCFLPAVATKFTTSCQSIYQWKNVNDFEFKKA
jgi:hypothetical protein